MSANDPASRSLEHSRPPRGTGAGSSRRGGGSSPSSFAGGVGPSARRRGSLLPELPWRLPDVIGFALVGVALAAIALSGCSGGDDSDPTNDSCFGDGACPEGFRCVDQVCITADYDGSTPEGRPSDGGADGAADGESGTGGDTAVSSDGETRPPSEGADAGADGSAGDAETGESIATPVCGPFESEEKIIGREDLASVEGPSEKDWAKFAEGRALAAGDFHNCAILEEGQVACWGQNIYGQLGTGSTSAREPSGQRVEGLSSADAVAAGAQHSCVITDSGGVRCWGRNHHGQLGNGEERDRAAPQTVEGLSNIEELALGGAHSCALTEGGEMFCWGRNNRSQLGGESGEGTNVPETVEEVSEVVDIAAGRSHTCAVETGGAVKCWGDNRDGQLGDGTWSRIEDFPQKQTEPVQVANIEDAASVAAAGRYTCARKGSGIMKCWGLTVDLAGTEVEREARYWWQIADEVRNDSRRLEAVGPESPLAMGGRHRCAVVARGNVECRGRNSYGQVGTGDFIEGYDGGGVDGISSELRALAAGREHTCALTEADNILCWGGNDYGQLGDGVGQEASSIRQPASAVADVEPRTRYLTFQTDGFPNCGVLADGSVRCRGSGGDGELGYRPVPEAGSGSEHPVRIPDIDRAVQVDAGLGHACALLETGKVVCWGKNRSGQVGRGTTGELQYEPAEVSGIDSAVQIEAGPGEQSCALLEGGGVRCWGKNDRYQLGDGTTEQRATPVEVEGVSSGVDLTVGRNHACVLLADGRVKCWGQFDGDDLVRDLQTPEVVAASCGELSGVVSISGMCGILEDGNVSCWAPVDDSWTVIPVQLGDEAPAVDLEFREYSARSVPGRSLLNTFDIVYLTADGSIHSGAFTRNGSHDGPWQHSMSASPEALLDSRCARAESGSLYCQEGGSRDDFVETW